MLAPVLACRLILDLRERGSETVSHSTGTIAFTAGVTSSKSNHGSPFSGMGLGINSSRTSSKGLVRPNGVILSTVGSIDPMGSGVEMDNMDIKSGDVEGGYKNELSFGSGIGGIRVDVERTTM